MLDETEKKECFKILELLSYDNLVSLTDTVSGKVVTVENKKEALEAIMLYTRTGEELLKRRKVRREHLYQYLAQEGYVEHPAADKASLLKKVLRLWLAKKGGKDSLEDEKAAFSLPSAKNKSSSEAKVVEHHEPSQAEIKPKLYDGDEAQLLAVHFSAWFYKMLESLQGMPQGGMANPDWGPQHFWQDAVLTIHCHEPDGEQEMITAGAEEISAKFLSMRVVDKLHLNPNLSNDSVMGKQDPHGLTMVMTCGTVHKEQHYIGVFEQTFGLIRDPREENNWKIKFSKLVLKASGCTNQAKLEAPS